VKAGLEGWLDRRWYGDIAPGIGLRALAGLYRVARAARGAPEPVRLPVPVLVIGNFTAGGTGKTPLVIALARELSARGWRPGIVSRGHGRRSEGPVRVEAETPVLDSGDEPKLMSEQSGVPVFVDADRVAAARAAIAAGCNLVLADDGLQHHRLARDLEIEVVDGQRGYGNGLLIPAGPLREKPRPCDFRVVNGGAQPPDWSMQLRLGDAHAIEDSARKRALSAFRGARVHAVAGIGNPDRFFASLRAAGLEPSEHPFPDHHEFESRDFSRMRGTILMTEKDAVKCRALGLEDAWAVPARAELPPEFFAALAERLHDIDARS
jgi:tetraacyldisaccharide 4'-kinase